MCLTRICHEAGRHLARLADICPEEFGPNPIAYRIRGREGDAMALYKRGSKDSRQVLTTGQAQQYLTELRDRSGL